jgi:hypothetical protein
MLPKARVRKIKPGNIHPGKHHLPQHTKTTASWPNSTDYPCLMHKNILKLANKDVN